MHTSQPPVRTHRAFDDQETFQQLMAERLSQSPWVLVSFGVHEIALLLVWALLPDEPDEFTATDGPEALRSPCERVDGRLLTWYGPSLLDARTSVERRGA